MSSPVDFDRTLSAWLDELAPMREPEGLTYAVLARTRRTRRIPGWATLERWFPMQTTYKFGAVPRTAIILVTLALLTALLGIAIALGASPPRKLPAAGRSGRERPHRLRRRRATSGSSNPMARNASSSPPARLGHAPVWSQDGTSIAYWSASRHTTSHRRTRRSMGAHVMNADGAKVRTLVEG